MDIHCLYNSQYCQDFPDLEKLARKAGFAGGVAAIVRTVASGEAVVAVPAEYAAHGIPIFVKKEWRSRVRENLGKLVVAGHIRFVGSASEAFLVIGDDSVSVRPDQVLIGINEETVSQVTPRLLQELQINGLLKAGAVVMLYAPLKDSVLVFA